MTNRTYNLIVVIALFLLMVWGATLPGCASTPLERAYITRATFNQTVADIGTARDQDLIDAKSYRTFIENIADPIVPVLDEMDRAAIAGDSTSFWNIYKALSPKLRDMVTQAMVLRQKRGK